MNIWIFNHYAEGPGSAGGSRHYDLAKNLVHRGHKVTIFASSFNHQTRKEKLRKGEKIREEYHAGVRFLWIRTFSYEKNNWRRVINMISYTFKAYHRSRAEIEKPDIVIGSLVHPLAAFLGCVVAKRDQAKFYFEERDLWPQTLIDLGKMSKKNPIIIFLKSLEKYLFNKAHRIIVLFDKAPQYVAYRGVNKDKIIYLPNGVDLKRYNQNNPSIPKELENFFNRMKRKFIAVYIGAHGTANELDALLETAKLLKENQDIHFLFVGDGPEKRRLVQKKMKEGIENLTFFPSYPKECIPAILSYSDIGLISMSDSPLYKWGFSLNKSYDYMAAALPFVLVGKIERNKIEECRGVIRAISSLECAKILEKLSKEQMLLKEIGEESRMYVEKNHSWETLSKKIERYMKKDLLVE
ncbi:glycosyltransferase family 4 protein [Halalkalibacterium ligniniphilum]|uniref:glycosyltransferase family 4 protein n=1 Tax=Halalkalibacterium ligniniphilum TaxID=1134413 RepID=UPI000346211B|nr:glycosyltransferase family 4 protein [Halalkalibacterium ligniniphilum]